MRKKSSSKLLAEADELRLQARQARAAEAHQERAKARYRQALLGVALQDEMVRDVALRASIEALMKRFCSRPRDRELFGFDQPETWFATLAPAPSGGEKARRPSAPTAGTSAVGRAMSAAPSEGARASGGAALDASGARKGASGGPVALSAAGGSGASGGPSPGARGEQGRTSSAATSREEGGDSRSASRASAVSPSLGSDSSAHPDMAQAAGAAR